MHIHHIIPRHAGGTDDPSNLIELTVAEHAEAHRVLYETHGRKQDWLAWKGLLGEVEKEDIVREARKLGGLNSSSRADNPFKSKEWQKANNPRLDREQQLLYNKLSNTPEAIAKKKATFKEIGHQQGSNNSQYGKRWIHSLIEKSSKRIDKNDPLPKDWLEGRKMKFDDA